MKWSRYGSTFIPTIKAQCSNFRTNPRNTRIHRFKLMRLVPKDGKSGAQSNSFFFWVAKEWNGQHAETVDAENIHTFKSRLDAPWVNRPNRFTIDSHSTILVFWTQPFWKCRNYFSTHSCMNSFLVQFESTLKVSY